MTPEPGTRRTITHDGWRITQIAQRDGTWWNMRIERQGGHAATPAPTRES